MLGKLAYLPIRRTESIAIDYGKILPLSRQSFYAVHLVYQDIANIIGQRPLCMASIHRIDRILSFFLFPLNVQKSVKIRRPFCASLRRTFAYSHCCESPPEVKSLEALTD